MDTLLNFIRSLKKNTNVPQIFNKIQKKGILPNSFYKATIILILKPGEDSSKKWKFIRPISLVYMDAKFSTKFLLTETNDTLKKSWTMIKQVSSLCKSIILTQHLNIIKGKKQVIDLNKCWKKAETKFNIL
jgi:hypothetical protein